MLRKILLATVFMGLSVALFPLEPAYAKSAEKDCEMVTPSTSILKVNDKKKLCSTMHKKISICHANNGIKDYTKNSVSYKSIIKNNGHAMHQDGRDIIPKFTYIQEGVSIQFPGLNWDKAGKATWKNDCKVVPTKPSDKVVAVVTSILDCTAEIVTTTTTTTTTGTELVDNIWKETAPIVTTETSTRTATEDELVSCPVTIPDQPTDTVSITTVTAVDCSSKLATITTSTTTTGTELVDNIWKETAPTITTETSTRAATEAELVSCPVTPETPVDSDDGDVLGSTTESGVSDGTTIKELPFTSGDNASATALLLASVTVIITLLSIATRTILTKSL